MLTFATNLRWLILAFHKILFSRSAAPGAAHSAPGKAGHVISEARCVKHASRENGIAHGTKRGYSASRADMKYLTKEQQKVLCGILLLLFVGLAVKTWRTTHPPKQAGQAQK